jgi:N-acetylmuramoyl-L-alanine amidase
LTRKDELRRGAHGARVRELHERLSSLGLGSADALESFADATAATVESFQRTRGLPITGVVDATTWDRLIEAGWALGERLLYVTDPYLRGDDVAELQTRLAQLGFDPGRIDGIFGPVLESALRDFQRNRGLPVDGTLTRATLNDLLRLSSMATDRHLVTEARDLAGFHKPTSGIVVLCGEGSLVEAVRRSLADALEVLVVSGAEESWAAPAKQHHAPQVQAVAPVEELEGLRLHFWASYRSHSRRGDALAGEIAGELARAGLGLRVEVTGMALPVLRETRMTTLQIEHGDLAGTALLAAARGVARVITKFFHR